jgi:fructose-1,6-bisphosphatase I
MDNLISALEKSFKEISKLVRNQNSLDLGGLLNENNVSGDDVKELDVVSNDLLKHNLSQCSLVRTIGSEEEDELYQTSHVDAPYLVCYDPLDGSSNVDVNITTGTIFAVYQYDENGRIENGRNIVMSGYCLYGGCTQYILAYNGSVSMYQYIPSKHCFTCKNEFVKIHENMKVQEKGTIFSLNEAHKHKWCDKRFQPFIETMIEQKYNARWVGSMVADGHRTLIKGGFFAYPANESSLQGKIRLLYEAYPFAHIFETAGGISTDGITNILDIPYPEKLHQKTPIILSSKTEYDIFAKL